MPAATGVLVACRLLLVCRSGALPSCRPPSPSDMPPAILRPR